MASKLYYIAMALILSQCLTVAAVQADEFLAVKNLLKENRPAQAYKILITKEYYHMGEPEYDLLLARTAIQAGHTHEAIFAYERVLINKPGHHLARVELAIAHYKINELENAQRYFNKALSNNPPDDIKKIILSYVDRINEKISTRKHSLSGILTIKEGWDSNINNATNESEVELTIGTYRPTEGVDRKTSDTYTEVSNSLNYNYNFNVNSKFFSAITYSNRENNNKRFDTQTASIKTGYTHNTALGKISIPVTYQTMWLDKKQLREVSNLSISLNRSDKNSFTDYSLQYGEIRYPGQAPLNVDMVAASFAFGFSDSSSGFNQQYALFYGDETPTNNLYEFNAREYWGMQVQLPMQLSNHHVITPKLVYQVAEYHQRHPFFKEKRKDHFVAYELAWNWYFDRSWSLKTQLGHTESSSTVSLYNHTKTVIFTGINFLY